MGMIWNSLMPIGKCQGKSNKYSDVWITIYKDNFQNFYIYETDVTYEGEILTKIYDVEDLVDHLAKEHSSLNESKHGHTKGGFVAAVKDDKDKSNYYIYIDEANVLHLMHKMSTGELHIYVCKETSYADAELSKKIDDKLKVSER